VTALSQWTRTAGLFVLNFFVAAVFTYALSRPFIRFSSAAIVQSIWRNNIFDAIAAFGLGYFVYRRWGSSTSKWVWVPALLWFTQRAITFWFENRTFRVLHGDHTIYWEMSGAGCVFDRQACSDWIVYTIPLIRTAFYSAGALFCAEYRRHESSWLNWLAQWRGGPIDRSEKEG